MRSPPTTHRMRAAVVAAGAHDVEVAAAGRTVERERCAAARHAEAPARTDELAEVEVEGLEADAKLAATRPERDALGAERGIGPFNVELGAEHRIAVD